MASDSADERQLMERRMMIKAAFIEYYRSERDRSEKCLGEIIELFTERGTTDAEINVAILERLITHYARR